MKNAKKYVMTPYNDIESAVDPAEEAGLDDVQFGGSLGDPGISDLLAAPSPPGGSLDAQASQVSKEPRKRNAIRERALDKATKTAKIIMRLAAVNGYNDDFEIKLRDGKYLRGSNLVHLIWHVLTPAREVQGLKEFTELLRDAGVQSDWIDNPNVRTMLANMDTSRRPAVAEPARPSMPKRFVSKRRGEDLVEEPGSKQVKRQRLEDQVHRIQEIAAPQAPPSTPAQPSKRSFDEFDIEDEDQQDADVEDIPMPIAPPPPLRSEVLRKRKQNIARKLHRGDWSDNDD